MRAGGLFGVEDAGAGALFCDDIPGVVKGADAEGKAAAADATVELVAEAGESIDAIGEVIAPVLGEVLPVLSGWGTALGKGIEGVANLCEGDARALGDFDEGDAPENVAGVSAVVAFVPPAFDQTLSFVEMDGRDGDATASGDLADGKGGGNVFREFRRSSCHLTSS